MARLSTIIQSEMKHAELQESVLTKIGAEVRKIAAKVKNFVRSIDFSAPAPNGESYTPESFFKDGVYGRLHI